MLKKTLIGLAALFLLLAGAAGVAFFTLDPNLLKPHVERAISAGIGHPFKIGGDLDIERGWILRIRADDIHVGGPKGSELGSVQTLRASLDLWDLLTRQRISLPEVSLDRPTLRLERDEQGKGNWQPLDRRERSQDGQARLPMIGKLAIKDARIDYRDARTRQEISTSLATLTAVSPSHDAPVQLVAKGQVNDLPLQLDGTFGAYRLLAGGREPYPAKGTLTLGRSTIALDGTIADPADLEGVDLDIKLTAVDLTRALAMFGLPALEIPPFNLAGQLTRQDGQVRLDQLDGRVGDSMLRGWVGFALADDRPRISGELTSERFDLDDLAGLIGLPPAAGPGETASPRQEAKAERARQDGYVIPDTPLNAARWQTLDVDVRFLGKRVNAGRLPLQEVEFHLVLDHGKLRIDPLNATVANAAVQGKVMLDSAKKPPRTEIDLAANGLELEQFLGAFDLAEYGRGRIYARLALQGEGEGLRTILGSSQGQIALTMSEGALSALIVEALHLDLAEVLVVLFGEEPGTPEALFGVRCLVADLQVEKGIAYTRSFVLDTTDSLITAKGALNLGTEAIELDLNAEPKDNSLFAAPSTLYLRGRFAAPTVSPDMTGVALRGVAAAALGVALTPLAAFLPFIEIGTAENAPCAALIGKAEGGD